MSAWGTYRFYSVQRQTILLVNGEPLGRERVKNLRETNLACEMFTTGVRLWFKNVGEF